MLNLREEGKEKTTYLKCNICAYIMLSDKVSKFCPNCKRTGGPDKPWFTKKEGIRCWACCRINNPFALEELENPACQSCVAFIAQPHVQLCAGCGTNYRSSRQMPAPLRFCKKCSRLPMSQRNKKNQNKFEQGVCYSNCCHGKPLGEPPMVNPFKKKPATVSASIPSPVAEWFSVNPYPPGGGGNNG